MSKTLWHDSAIDKPTNPDPVLGLTSEGYIVIVQWKDEFGKFPKRWYELSRDEEFSDVVWWSSDFTLPHGWKISDDYYEGVD